MLRYVIIFYCLLWMTTIQAQNLPTDTLLDTRDGKRYPIVQIENTWWMQANLQYETTNSYCPNFNKKASDCSDANFYSYQELDQLCPDAWHVAKLEEWEAYFDWQKRQKGVTETQIEIEPLLSSLNTGAIVTDTTEQIQLLATENPLQLTAVGWVQGKKRQKIGTITLWARHEAGDAHFHLHIGSSSYVKHTHKHHIVDKPRRNRKFAVRCVQD